MAEYEEKGDVPRKRDHTVGQRMFVDVVGVMAEPTSREWNGKQGEVATTTSFNRKCVKLMWDLVLQEPSNYMGIKVYKSSRPWI